MAGLTPFQTVGPFLSLGLRVGLGPLPCPEGRRRIVIRGRLLDGEARGIPDGTLEFWHPQLGAIQRVLVDGDGAFVVETVAPRPVPGPGDREQAAHFAVRVLARGILTQYVTRIYLADDPTIASDPILSLVPTSRRHTLVASLVAPDVYRFDVVVQGDNETVFFEV